VYRSRARLLLFLVLPVLAFPRARGEKIVELQSAATKFNSLIAIPAWPRTSLEMDSAMREAIARGNAILDRLGAQDLAKVTFRSTVVAFDDAIYEAEAPERLAGIIAETNADVSLRTAAEKASKTYDAWRVAIDYRADVYNAIKAFAATKPQLEREDKKLLEETLRDYRRAGLDLRPEARGEVARLRKELADATADFGNNIAGATAPVVFSKAELEGVPDSWLGAPGIKTGADSYTFSANLEAHYGAIEDNARSEVTRRKFYLAHDSLAKAKNVAVLNRMFTLRNQIALRLGYRSWADYQTEIRMVGTAAKAEKFVNDLIAGLEPKFRAEVAALQKMKATEAKDPTARLCVWDWRYYTNQSKKQQLAFDAESLRQFFPYEKVHAGLFAIYGKIFGLKFQSLSQPDKWTDRLELWSVTDATSGEPLGLIYLDLFAHPGKANASGESEPVGGKLLPNEKYQRRSRRCFSLFLRLPKPRPLG
jgi:thimet oligopeptidase